MCSWGRCSLEILGGCRCVVVLVEGSAMVTLSCHPRSHGRKVMLSRCKAAAFGGVTYGDSERKASVTGDGNDNSNCYRGSSKMTKSWLGNTLPTVASPLAAA